MSNIFIYSLWHEFSLNIHSPRKRLNEKEEKIFALNQKVEHTDGFLLL